MDNDLRMYTDDQNELYHHGILGQKWGVRRYQNADGTLTAAGKKKYGEKVTMHRGKENMLLGGRTYQTHKEYKTANKFAKASYLKRKEEIKEEKKNSQDGFLKKNLTAFNKNWDNRSQYQYELDRNRNNAGVNEFKRGAIISGSKKAAIVGAAVLGGYFAASTMNVMTDRMNGVPSKGKNAIAKLGADHVDSYWQYKVGKKEVAKALAGAVAMGALTEMTKTSEARNRISIEDSRGDTRAKRARADEQRWQKGMV
jgi:competence protein ComGC